MLVDQKVDAFATDDILLYGLIARHKSQNTFRVTGDYLSYDPYGIMFRKGEPQVAAVVERAMRKLATNQDLLPLYKKWFVVTTADRRKTRRADLAAASRSLSRFWTIPPVVPGSKAWFCADDALRLLVPGAMRSGRGR